MTKNGDYSLTVRMVDSLGTVKKLTYETFVIGAGPTYPLTVSNPQDEAFLNRRVRDALSEMNTFSFSTLDADQERHIEKQ